MTINSTTTALQVLIEGASSKGAITGVRITGVQLEPDQSPHYLSTAQSARAGVVSAVFSENKPNIQPMDICGYYHYD